MQLQFLLQLVGGSDFVANFGYRFRRLENYFPADLYDNDNTEFAMKEIEVSGHKVRYHENIDELPIVRFHKWQKFLLIDSGIGADLSSLDQHLERARRYCKTNKPDLAEKELMNLRQCVWFVQRDFSPKLMAFAALVVSIDDKPCEDLSDDALMKVAEQLGVGTKKELNGTMNAVKKKINADLMLYFPKLFGDSDTKEYYDLLRRKAGLLLQGVKEGKFEDKAIDDLDDQIILYSSPREFSGSEGAEVQFDKQFENLCLTLAQQMGMDAKTKTVLEFYNAFEFLKEKHRKEAQQTPHKR